MNRYILLSLLLLYAIEIKSQPCEDDLTLASSQFDQRDFEGLLTTLFLLDSLSSGVARNACDADGALLLGKMYYEKNAGKKSQKWLLFALAWYEQNDVESVPELLTVYEYLGLLNRYLLLQPYQALKWLERALELIESTPNLYPEEERRICYLIAANHFLVHDSGRAFLYGRRGFQLANESEVRVGDRVKHFNQMGILFAEDLQFDSALVYYNRALEILPDQEEFLMQQIILRSNIARVLFLQEDFLLSIKLQLETLRIFNSQSGVNALLEANIYTILALNYRGVEDFVEMDKYRIKVEETLEKHFGVGHYRVADNYCYWSEAYLDQPSEALPKLDAALVLLWPELTKVELDSATLPKETDWKILIKTLTNKAVVLRNQAIKNGSSLDISLKYHEKAIEAYHSYRRQFLKGYSIVNHSRNDNSILEEALKTVSLSLSEKNTDWSTAQLQALAWRAIEYGKSSLLQQNFLQSQAKQENLLPDSLYEKYIDINYQHYRFSSRGQRQDSLYFAQRRVVEWENMVNEYFPAYQKYLQQSEMVTLSGVRKVLAVNDLLINFFEGESHVYAMAIGQEKTKLWHVKRDEQWLDQFNMYVDFVSDLNPEALSAEESNKALKVGYSLYQDLVLPANVIAADRVIFSPSGSLESLPFEALPIDDQVSNPLSYHTHPYMVWEVPVQYALSGSHWEYNWGQTIEVRKVDELYAQVFAWGDFNDNDSLSALPASSLEADEIGDIWSAEIYKNEQVSEGLFRQTIETADVLHLALHGMGDQDGLQEPKLIFPGQDEANDGSLFLHELYGLKASPEIVVLSACESAEGTYQAGEGTMSMARGFIFSGSRAIISNLWESFDFSALQLLREWHLLIKEGLDPALALQRSKCEYLSNAGPLEGHPSRWAGVILMGKPPKLIVAEQLNVLLPGIVACFLFALFLIFKVRNH